MELQPRVDSNHSSLLSFVLGLCVGAVAIGIVATVAGGVGWTARTPSELSSGIRDGDIVRDVTVSYMYETDPGSASGNNDMPVESIAFYPGYVVITQASGQSQLLAVDRLRRFRFEPAKSKVTR